MGEREDLLRHLENALAINAKAVGEVKRSQDWQQRVLPSLELNYMQVEKRRLQAATAAAESAHRHIEEARQEIEITKNLLIERSKP